MCFSHFSSFFSQVHFQNAFSKRIFPHFSHFLTFSHMFVKKRETCILKMRLEKSEKMRFEHVKKCEYNVKKVNTWEQKAVEKVPVS